ncbi:MAG: RHS domain-containing protein [Polyangiaceae bacterium]|nr:RHS domain-containing protein [Polyangiaceae bacterium]
MLERAWLYRNQLNPVAELDGSGALVARFVYGARSNVPEYVVRGGVTYRVLSDHLGSPRALVDVATGTAAWRADFDAWGNRTLIAGAADFVPFGFAGGMLDHETGLTRFGARDYDPTVGRWTSKDPIRWAGRSGNLYAYARTDPMNRRDPTGRQPIEGGGGTSGFGIGGSEGAAGAGPENLKNTPATPECDACAACLVASGLAATQCSAAVPCLDPESLAAALLACNAIRLGCLPICAVCIWKS